MKLEINKVRIGDVLVLSLIGEINADGAEQLRTFLKSSYSKKFNLFIFDLIETRYICSAGLRVFLELNKELMPYNGKMRFVRPDTQVFQVFEMSGLNQVFDFYLTASEAILEWIIPPKYKLIPKE